MASASFFFRPLFVPVTGFSGMAFPSPLLGLPFFTTSGSADEEEEEVLLMTASEGGCIGGV